MREGIKLTPMMEQWAKAKSEHHDAILLFRMGDFYELFGDDAIIASPILGLALTSRDKDKSGLKMAGFPFHAADNYIAKLIDHGHKVAICEQLEDPKLSRGIVKRGITNVVTPGTALETEIREESAYSFLLSIVALDENIALCALDLKTATFKVTSSTSSEKIFDEAMRLNPSEVIVKDSDDKALRICDELSRALMRSKILRVEKRKERTSTIPSSVSEDFSFTEIEREASSLIITYLFDLKGSVPGHLDSPRRYSIESQLLMDESTRNNLDLFPKKKGDEHNLFRVLDHTKTIMGRRALYQSLRAPSTSLEEISRRHELVFELFSDTELRTALREHLASCYDLEKFTALIASSKISPRALAHMRDTLNSVEKIVELINNSTCENLKTFFSTMPHAHETRDLLLRALSDEPPIYVRDGGVLRFGYDEKLDELRGLVTDGQQLLLELEQREREESKIPSLKIKFTRVFGYYIEITRTHLEKVPSHYQRKQTVANGERYVTRELSELEHKLNNAETDAIAIEEARFSELIQIVAIDASKLMMIGKTIALLDVVCNFAELSYTRNLVRPIMKDADECVIDIHQGRHFIVEDLFLKVGNFFVHNDVLLDKVNSMMLITGPNMAGKSTIMRQVALIQIMAQIGCFVPASSATLSICDAIFARVGASDDLATGRSTFMVEMTETASILKNATKNSLILLDEIGRGTSTYDGLSIAQAVAEFIHDELKTRTLFATHYHELTKLHEKLPRLQNFHVQIEERDKDIRFLYTLGEGPCLKSFGIQVAHLSGLPKTVLTRAQEILLGLEEKEMSRARKNHRPQLDLFTTSAVSKNKQEFPVVKEILSLDLNGLTPIEALNKLAGLQSSLKAICLHPSPARAGEGDGGREI